LALKKLSQDVTQIQSARDELGQYGVKKNGQEFKVSGSLPDGAKDFTQRQKDFDKLKANDPELAADMEKIAPIYKKLALNQKLTPEEVAQFDEVIGSRREAQMKEMYKKHADFKAQKPEGQSAEDYLKAQQKRAEAAGIAGTPLAKMLLITDTKDVESIVISNNLQGAAEIKEKGKTDLTRLDMQKDLGLTPPIINAITSDKLFNENNAKVVDIPGKGKMVEISGAVGTMDAVATSLLAQGVQLDSFDNNKILIPYDKFQPLLSKDAVKKLEGYDTGKRQINDGAQAIQSIQAKQAQTHPTNLRDVKLEDHLKGNPEDPAVKTVVKAQSAVKQEEEHYKTVLKAHEEKHGVEYLDAKRKLEALKDTNTPEATKQRRIYQHTVDAYDKDVAALQIEHGKNMQRLLSALRDSYDKLPDYKDADPKVKQAADERKKVAMDTPEQKDVYRKEFESSLKQLEAKAASDPLGLNNEFRYRRARLGLDPEGSGKPATREMLDAYYKDRFLDNNASKEKLDEFHKDFERKAVPVNERDPKNSQTPITPENIREKAKYAYPELTDLQREEKIREQFPSLDKYKAQASHKPLENDTIVSGKAKDYIKYIDQQEVFKNPQGHLVYFDNAPLPDQKSAPTGNRYSVGSIFKNDSFGTLETITNGKINYSNVPVLSEQGKQDIADLAEILKKRAQSPDISADEKAKYELHLKNLREYTKGKAAYTRAIPDVGKAWKEINDLIADDNIHSIKPAVSVDSKANPKLNLGDAMAASNTKLEPVSFGGPLATPSSLTQDKGLRASETHYGSKV
jgi:hypothetical protein